MRIAWQIVLLVFVYFDLWFSFLFFISFFSSFFQILCDYSHFFVIAIPQSHLKTSKATTSFYILHRLLITFDKKEVNDS